MVTIKLTQITLQIEHKRVNHGITESQNIPSWTGPIRIIEFSSWNHTGLPKNSDHMTKSRIQTLLKLQQTWCSAYFPGVPVPVRDNLTVLRYYRCFPSHIWEQWNCKAMYLCYCIVRFLIHHSFLSPACLLTKPEELVKCFLAPK